MSRIILQNYDNGDIRYVVGWDRPCQSYFWQEFSKEHDDQGKPIWDYDESWQEMVAYAGYGPREIPTPAALKLSAPKEIEELLTKVVIETLWYHKEIHEDPGRVVVDMTKTPPTVEQRR